MQTDHDTWGIFSLRFALCCQVLRARAEDKCLRLAPHAAAIRAFTDAAVFAFASKARLYKFMMQRVNRRRRERLRSGGLGAHEARFIQYQASYDDGQPMHEKLPEQGPGYASVDLTLVLCRSDASHARSTQHAVSKEESWGSVSLDCIMLTQLAACGHSPESVAYLLPRSGKRYRTCRMIGLERSILRNSHRHGFETRIGRRSSYGREAFRASAKVTTLESRVSGPRRWTTGTRSDDVPASSEASAVPGSRHCRRHCWF